MFAPSGTSCSRNTTRRRWSCSTQATPRPSLLRNSLAVVLFPDPELPRITAKVVVVFPVVVTGAFYKSNPAVPVELICLCACVLLRSVVKSSDRGHQFSGAFSFSKGVRRPYSGAPMSTNIPCEEDTDVHARCGIAGTAGRPRPRGFRARNGQAGAGAGYFGACGGQQQTR